VVVNAVLLAIPSLLDVVSVGLLFYYIFAVLAVNLLMGGMYSCTDPTGSGDPLDAYYVLPQGTYITKVGRGGGGATRPQSLCRSGMAMVVI
jgi:hypothetical protein